MTRIPGRWVWLDCTSYAGGGRSSTQPRYLLAALGVSCDVTRWWPEREWGMAAPIERTRAALRARGVCARPNHRFVTTLPSRHKAHDQHHVCRSKNRAYNYCTHRRGSSSLHKQKPLVREADGNVEFWIPPSNSRLHHCAALDHVLRGWDDELST